MKLPLGFVWLYFSPKQYRVVSNNGQRHLYYKTITGKIVEVTEVSRAPRPSGLWNDYRRVGM